MGLARFFSSKSVGWGWLDGKQRFEREGHLAAEIAPRMLQGVVRKLNRRERPATLLAGSMGGSQASGVVA
ncbi:MAG: hypothetical protein AAFX40_18440, partial [Cyanobacteria bacterium J06639_1]